MSLRLPKTKIHSMTLHQPNTFNTVKNITMPLTPPFPSSLHYEKKKKEKHVACQKDPQYSGKEPEDLHDLWMLWETVCVKSTMKFKVNNLKTIFQNTKIFTRVWCWNRTTGPSIRMHMRISCSMPHKAPLPGWIHSIYYENTSISWQLSEKSHPRTGRKTFGRMETEEKSTVTDNTLYICTINHWKLYSYWL